MIAQAARVPPGLSSDRYGTAVGLPSTTVTVAVGDLRLCGFGVADALGVKSGVSVAVAVSVSTGVAVSVPVGTVPVAVTEAGTWVAVEVALAAGVVGSGAIVGGACVSVAGGSGVLVAPGVSVARGIGVLVGATPVAVGSTGGGAVEVGAGGGFVGTGWVGGG